VKGAIVALQWRYGMHGFEESRARRIAVSGRPAIATAGAQRLVEAMPADKNCGQAL
jgi:hypothetical protein